MSTITGSEVEALSPETVAAISRAVSELRPYAADGRVAGAISKLEALAAAEVMKSDSDSLSGRLERLYRASEGADLTSEERYKLNKGTAAAYREYLAQVSPRSAAVLDRNTQTRSAVPVAKRDAYVALHDHAMQIRKRDSSLSISASLERAIRERPDLAAAASAA